MGLYDNPVGALDPRSMAFLQAGLGMMSGPSMTPVSLGQQLGRAGQIGMNAFQQTQQANQQNQLFAMKMAEQKKAEEERARQAAAMQQFVAQNPHLANLAQLDPKMALQRGFPEAPKPQFLDTVDEQGRPVKKAVVPEVGATLPGYRAELDPSVRLAKRDDAVATAQALQPLKLETAKASATVIQPDNLGLKPIDRFNMEDKLRNDFRGNPVVKASDEMNSAFKLIETARNNPSPANDLAMATKYMKVLDPGSVVRESELALAMGAGGLMDKVQNYANMVLTGKKLTPSQREDFYTSAKAINESFLKERDGIAGRFKENAIQYNLTPENVIGAPRAQTKLGKVPQVEDWVSRAMKANMVNRSTAIKEGKRLGKVPEEYEE